MEQYSALYTLATILWREEEPDQFTVNVVRQTEVGVKYQFNKALELTIAYSCMKRTDTATAPYDTHDGQLVRFQLQVELLTTAPVGERPTARSFQFDHL